MNNINPILDAMSEIDDNIIANTNIKRSKKRPLLIAVAAAAVLTVIMGAAVVSRSHVTINKSHLLDYTFTVQENVNTEPFEQLREMGAKLDGSLYDLTARPSEVFELLNIHPLINDNFTDEECDMAVMFLRFGEPVETRQLMVRYDLIDKKTNVKLMLETSHKLVEDTAKSSEYVQVKKYKLLDLNDGSKALVYSGDEYGPWIGSFSYNGIIYDFHTSYTDYDTFLQTFDHLGIL